MGEVFDYIKTGFKLFILWMVLSLIYFLVNAFMLIILKVGIVGAVFTLSGGFMLAVAVIIILGWILISLLIGGYFANKFWGWE